jgi:replicative DNA helicase
MEENLSKGNPLLLDYKHISKAADEIIEYIDLRRQGKIRSLHTRWDKFNRCAAGGIDWNTVMTIAGMSGSGKSSIANEMETSLFDMNPKENFAVLSFNFEMLAMKQVGRKLSSKIEKPVSELYSSHQVLGDTDFNKIKEIKNKVISKYDIFYIDVPGNIEQIYYTIKKFYFEQRVLRGDDFGVVVFLDHTLLTKGKQRESEREMLSRLYRAFMVLKKEIKCIFVILSQLNRDIESSDRLSNPTLQYPMKKDIFGSDAVFHGSDYVLITHRPYMLNLQAYGPHNLPVVNPRNQQQAMIYWHLIKNREGTSGVVMSMLDNLKFNKVDEFFDSGKIEFNS